MRTLDFTSYYFPLFFFFPPYSDLSRFSGSGEVFGGVTPAASITRWKAATVGGEGLKLRPGRWPSAITRGVRLLLFGRFQISILAPREASSSTTFGWLR